MVRLLEVGLVDEEEDEDDGEGEEGLGLRDEVASDVPSRDTGAMAAEEGQ